MLAERQMPLAEMLQILQQGTHSLEQRAVIAVMCGRWLMQQGQEAEALQVLHQALELVPDLRPAMRWAYQIYRRQNNVHEAIKFLDQEIRVTRHPREIAALYRERGKLLESDVQNANSAVKSYQAALKATPRDLAVLRALESILLRQQHHVELMDNLEAQLDVVHDPQAAAALLVDLAMLMLHEGVSADECADYLWLALKQVPGDICLIGDFLRLSQQSGDERRILHALELSLEIDSSVQATSLVLASEILLRAQEDDAAAHLLWTAAKLQPNNLSYWQKLEDLSIQSQFYSVAVAACQGQLQAIPPTESKLRAEIFYRMGHILMHELNRGSLGLESMRKALALAPDHISALQDAARYLKEHQYWAQLLELLRLQVHTAQAIGLSSSEIALSQLRVAQVLEEHLGELEGARQLYEQICKNHPSFRPARDQLETILYQLGRTDELIDFYEDELKQPIDEERKYFILALLSRLLAQRDDPNPAIKAIVTVLKRTPKHLPSIQLLAQLLGRAGRSQDLLRITKQEIKLTSDPARCAKLLHRAGELALEIGDRQQAYTCFSEAIEADASYLPSFGYLEKMLREDHRYEELVSLLTRYLLQTADRERKQAMQLEIATLLAEKLNQKFEALQRVRAFLQETPGFLPALYMGERWANELNLHSDLIALLEEHFATSEDPQIKAILLYRIALVQYQKLNDVAGAIHSLQRATTIWPQLDIARSLLIDLSQHEVGYRNVFFQAARNALVWERGISDRQYIAQLFAEYTPDTETAFRYLNAVVSVQPHRLVNQRRLARVARRTGHLATAATSAYEISRLLAQQSSKSTEPEVFVGAFRYLAARAAEANHQYELARLYYHEVLQLDSHVLTRLAEQGLARTQDTFFANKIQTLHSLVEENSSSDVKCAVFWTQISEIYLQQKQIPAALESLQKALRCCPSYIPAIHLKIHLLCLLAEPHHITQAIEELTLLSESLHVPKHKVRALCQAGKIALQHPHVDPHGELAWQKFAMALTIDPSSDLAFQGLWQISARFGSAEKASASFADALRRRVEQFIAVKTMDATHLRAIARLCREAMKPSLAIELLEYSQSHQPSLWDAALHIELAQLYAHQKQWSRAVVQVLSALRKETSPEQLAALHYFAAIYYEQAGEWGNAANYFVKASHSGFRNKETLQSALRNAEQAKDAALQLQILKKLVEISDDNEACEYLQDMIELYLGDLNQPEQAANAWKELLRYKPTHIEGICWLAAFQKQHHQDEEANATLMSALLAFRQYIYRYEPRPNLRAQMDALAGLIRVFDLLAEENGAYHATAILEVIAPKHASAYAACHIRMQAPWPLPKKSQQSFDWPLTGLTEAKAVAFLQAGMPYIAHLPQIAGTPVEMNEVQSVATHSDLMLVIQALADVFELPVPSVYRGSLSPEQVMSCGGSQVSALVVGTHIADTPFLVLSRDKLGRALFRFAMGGDHLHEQMTDKQLLAIFAGFIHGVGFELPKSWEVDLDLMQVISNTLQHAPIDTDFIQKAEDFVSFAKSFAVQRFRASLQAVEDRIAVICAADPHASLELIKNENGIASERMHLLISYLLSDEHFALQRDLGYRIEVELDTTELEEIKG